MLSYALAIAVAISSLILFSTAFFMSKIHRRDDFLWSAVGLFYALILWFCARNITGTVLLGQAAATVLITSYCWQTIKLRRVIANPGQVAEKNSFSVVDKLGRLFKRKPKLEAPAPPVVKPPTPKVTEQEISIPETPATAAPTPTPEVNVAPPIEKSLEQTVVDAQPTPDVKPIEKKVDNKAENLGGVAESEPLPNKIPETEAIASPAPVKIPQVETPPSVSQIDELVTEAAAEVNPKPQIVEPEAQTTEAIADNITQTKVEPAPEIVTPEVATPEVETKSNFDSLETVEVAEVLEAEVDNNNNQRESDRDSIIEVTTTEINVVTETTKIDRNQANDSDLQDV